MSRSCKFIATNYDWTWAIPALLSPIWDDSIIIDSSNASVGVANICCTMGNLMWGNNATMNDILCCCEEILKFSLSMNVLNLWSKAHTIALGLCFIYFNSVIHCDSDLGFLNSNINTILISSRVLMWPAGTVGWNFMYQTKALSLNVVAN